jgi:NADPH:quinone reductase
VPDTLSSEVAAALPTPGVTALQMARSLEPVGEKTIAVAGAGGAVGGYLTQLLASAGARVLAIALPTQADRVRGNGAGDVISAPFTALPAEIRRVAPDGVDALVDLISDAEQFAALTESIRTGGTAMSSRYSANGDQLASKNIQGVNFIVQMTSADLNTVAELAASDQLAPPPIRTVRFEDVPDLLNTGGDGFDGKSILRPE